MQHVTAVKTPDTHKVADELIHCLADTYLLYLKTQNFHWNVKGSQFYFLHKMFEEQYQALAIAVDDIAERIRALGCYTPASFSQFSNLSSLKEVTTELNAETMIEKLLQDHEIMIDHLTSIITKAQQAQDEGTADLLIQRLKEHEKTAWMLRSTLLK
ncbi:MAG: ferritin-like domain protein DpsA family [Gammaproteobacteria bacterium]|jgi:starvation-inducible DNA-binding protein|nr:ferritin-like domain protein DpsA family [Gammaproteobacteria bacterium]